MLKPSAGWSPLKNPINASLNGATGANNGLVAKAASNPGKANPAVAPYTIFNGTPGVF